MTEQEKTNTNEPEICKKWTRKKVILVSSIILLFIISGLAGYICKSKSIEEEWEDGLVNCGKGMLSKPVIYLYPEKEQETHVKLDYKGQLICTYPTYNDDIKGWRVKAYPDGKLINSEDGKEYSYLFWDGAPNGATYDMSKGFIIEGKDTVNFLQNTLSQMGLTPKEYNEFIVYWLPRMQNNKYNLIHFAEEEYTKNAPLEIAPRPDSLLRIFMVFKPLDEKVKVQPQEIKAFTRKGFTVVEWGGTELEK